MGLLGGVVMPHPPIVIDAIGGSRGDDAVLTKRAMREVAEQLSLLDPDVIVVMTPHANAYRDAFNINQSPQLSGDFAMFGHAGVSLEIPNACDFIDRIASALSDAKLTVEKGRDTLDHGALVPLMYIDEMLYDYEVVHLSISGLSLKDHWKAGEAIAAACKRSDKNVVFLASGDLSHALKRGAPHGHHPDGAEFDAGVEDALKKGEFSKLLTFNKRLVRNAKECGLRSMVTLGGALADAEHTHDLLNYEGPFGVGYAVSSHIRVSSWHTRLARRVIGAYIEEGEAPRLPGRLPDFLTKRRGCFVTLKKEGSLRGCIGTIEPTRETLAEEIENNALAAAKDDPRFAPVKREELSGLSVSVDVLSPLEAADEASLDPSRYGVVVVSGARKGVLLPDLKGIDAVEKQLALARGKAGIPEGAQCELYRFDVVRHEEA